MTFRGLALRLGAFLILPAAQAASLQRITDKLAYNPTNVGFYLYVPDTLAPSPPVLVNPHWCHGSASAAYNYSQFASWADTYGYLVIYPDAPNESDKCWDVSSHQSLSHNGGGDSLGIVSMVNYTLAKFSADPTRVFVTGVSSGAMMTSVLLGAYPDVFAAGSAYSGVPFGCFRAPDALQTSNRSGSAGPFDYWNADCATGKITKPADAWAAMVRAAFPAWTDDRWRPKVQIFHGTVDETLNYTCFTEEVKQWNAVLGLPQTPTSVTPDTPKPGWAKSVYGSAADDWFEAFSAAGVSHNIPHQDQVTLDWFELACTGADCFHWGKGGPRSKSILIRK